MWLLMFWTMAADCNLSKLLWLIVLCSSKGGWLFFSKPFVAACLMKFLSWLFFHVVNNYCHNYIENFWGGGAKVEYGEWWDSIQRLCAVRIEKLTSKSSKICIWNCVGWISPPTNQTYNIVSMLVNLKDTSGYTCNLFVLYSIDNVFLILTINNLFILWTMLFLRKSYWFAGLIHWHSKCTNTVCVFCIIAFHVLYIYILYILFSPQFWNRRVQ